MKNKKISKISMVASLLVAGIVNAQEFYTCVPKKDWWMDVVREGSKKWEKIIHLTPRSPQSDFQQTLLAGKYKVIAAGAGGQEEIREFVLDRPKMFKACAGEKGEDAVDDNDGGIGGDGMGYLGRYSSHCNHQSERCGYGGANLSYNMVECNDISGVSGCYKGNKGQGGGSYFCGYLEKRFISLKAGGGSGGGSYFEIGDIKLFLQSGIGEGGTETKYGKGAGPDGYVIIYKWE